MIRVLKIEAMKRPEVVEITNNLETLQNCVGGYIEAIYPFEEDVCNICNDSGKIMGFDLNRALRNADGKVVDIIAGTFLIVGVDEDDFCSLTDSQIDIYKEAFKQPEMFVDLNGKIEANCIFQLFGEAKPENMVQRNR